MEEELNCLFFFFLTISCQGSQYRTGGYNGLASGTIYFGYRSIPVYRFGFTAILYIIYIYIHKKEEEGKRLMILSVQQESCLPN